MEQDITIDTADGPMGAFISAPEQLTNRGIVVVQEAFGLTNHIKNICRRLADAGYLAIAPALFHRVGSPIIDYTDFDSAKEPVASLTAEGIKMDVAAAFGHLRFRGIANENNCGIIGFCMGGTVAFEEATTRLLGAAVTFYGSGIEDGRFGFPPLKDSAKQLRTPWLGHYGDKDTGIPSEQVEELRVATKGASVPTEIYRYPDAGHGFNCDDRSAFHAESAALAWKRSLDWFDQNISRS